MAIEHQEHRDELEEQFDADVVAERLEALGLDQEEVEGVRDAVEQIRLRLVEAFDDQADELEELFRSAA